MKRGEHWRNLYDSRNEGPTDGDGTDERPRCRTHGAVITFGCEECRALVGSWLCRCENWHFVWSTYCRACGRRRPVGAQRFLTSAEAVKPASTHRVR